MAPRIDPTLPLVWRSPSDLQLGSTAARVILRDAGDLESNLITALRHGVSTSTLLTMGTGLGAEPERVHRLLEALAPAFLPEPEPESAPGDGPAREPHREPGGTAARATPPLVVLDADGLLRSRLASSLNTLGYQVADVADPADAMGVSGVPDAVDAATLAVIAAPWVIRPSRYLPFLRRDVPHLAIVFDDTGARVGPLVEPGRGPCLRCLDLTRRDADAAWPAIAAQLAGRPAASRTTRSELDASAVAVAAVDDRLAHGLTGLAETSLTLERPGALPRRRRHEPHPDCGCRTPAGTATAPVRLAAHRPREASSARAGAVPA